MEHKGIKVKLQNILESTEVIIGHQCNCRGSMGAGVAKAILNKYSEILPAYKKLCRENQENTRELLGKLQLITCRDGKVIANLFGQDHYNARKTQTEVDKLRVALEDLRVYMIKTGKSLALPYLIGCGLAGGDWEEVSTMISEVFEGMEEKVVYYKI